MKLLVVEDESKTGDYLRQGLQEAGFVVDLASNLSEALSLIIGTPHRMAIVDLSLAGLDHRNDDGLRVLTALRRHDPACRAQPGDDRRSGRG